jgi:predicted RND superfamily exporter protein
MGPIHRRVLKDTLRLTRYPRIVLGIALLLAGISVFLACTRLRISTDQNKLFSPHVPFFHQYLQFIKRFPENEAAYVVIKARDPTHPPAASQWIKAANAVAASLKQIPEYVTSVDSHVPLKQLGDQSLLFAPWSKVRAAAKGSAALADLAAIWGEKPVVPISLFGKTRMQRFLELLATQSPSLHTTTFTRELCQSWLAAMNQRTKHAVTVPHLSALLSPGPTTPASAGYYYIRAGNGSEHLLLINVYPRFTFDSLAAVSLPLDKIHAAMMRAATAFHSEFTFGMTGRPVLAADEMRITTSDSDKAETLAMIVVLIGLILMLRSIWMGFAAGITLAIAIAWTFGFATLFVGELNLLSTVFVIALIGIGMDYLIQIMVRYRREARRYERQQAVWARVFRYAGPPIATACAGAAGAFLVALTTHFRGDAELGLIAGGGLLLCLLAGYTVLPALLVSFPPKLGSVDPTRRYTDDRPPPRAGARNFLGLGVWLAILVGLLPFALTLRFDPNLLDLQARGLTSVKLVKQMPTWYAVVVSKSLAKLAPIRAELNRAAGDAASPVLSTSSLLDAPPKQQYLAAHNAALRHIQWSQPAAVTPTNLSAIAQAATALADRWNTKLTFSAPAAARSAREAVAALRRFAAQINAATPGERIDLARQLARWQGKFVDSLKSMAAMLTPGPLNIARLPQQVSRHFVSADGHYALYIHPRFDLWNQSRLREFVTTVQGTRNKPGLVPRDVDLTGIAIQLYHSTESIRSAFMQCTILALLVVIFLVYLDLGSLGRTAMTVSVLALGLPMLTGIMGVLGLKWNFANFFAMPILIGAGHEYGVFMMHRYREAEHNPRRIWRFWDVSERALLMCAFVTCSSFGFLGLSRDRGIASLGIIMALGIACIYLAAIFVIRPLLTWRLANKGIYTAASQAENKRQNRESSKEFKLTDR